MDGYYLNNVTKIFEINNKEEIVFNNLKLFIPSNEITVILGKSGCGKTTLLRILSKLESVSNGEVYFKEENEIITPKVGNVFQESRLMPWLTVEDNILIHSSKGEKELLDLEKYLELMGLTEYKGAFPKQLSGGMAQRVAIARALTYNPNILLMDEPFSALDYFTRLALQEEILKVYKETKKGIIFVTHNIDEAIYIANRILVMKKGEDIKEFIIQREKINEEEYVINIKNKLLKLF